MNDEELNQLFRSARAHRPDTSRAEYGFETRLLARLRADREQPAPWYAFTWRLMPAFAAVVVAIGVWTVMEWGAGSNNLQTAIASDYDENTLAAYLTGDSL
ncbi:MAG TPA: hypothetical protein VLZ30_10745 [Verrucomicrobiae bacterium]|nr:hypothetical protein [Verrucomicrobiae bacterium]